MALPTVTIGSECAVTELVPAGETTAESTMVMNINMGGMAQQVVATTSIKMTVAPGK